MKMRVYARIRSLASPLHLISAGVLLMMAAVLWLSTPGQVTAAGSDLTNAVTQYPELDGTRLDSCDLCHISTDPVELNPYGQDYLASGRTMQALVDIEPVDSDGDGVTNDLEIGVLVQPGDETETAVLSYIPLISR
jgi:hypothetical protein